MVALGGVGYFYGGLLGAAFLLLEEVLSTHFEYWQIYVGLILLLVVMVAPRGVSSLATIGKTLKQESSMGREQAAVALSVKGLKKNYGGLAATRCRPGDRGGPRARHHRSQWRGQDHLALIALRCAGSGCGRGLPVRPAHA
jgi:hypothetical protein